MHAIASVGMGYFVGDQSVKANGDVAVVWEERTTERGAIGPKDDP